MKDIIKNWDNIQEAREQWINTLNENIKDLSDKNLTKLTKHIQTVYEKLEVDDQQTDLIAMIIGICSKIKDLDKVEFIDEKFDSEKCIKINISREQIDNLSLMGIHPFELIQNAAINEISDGINKIIDKNGKVSVYRFVESVSVISEGRNPPQMIIKSYIK